MYIMYMHMHNVLLYLFTKEIYDVDAGGYDKESNKVIHGSHWERGSMMKRGDRHNKTYEKYTLY